MLNLQNDHLSIPAGGMFCPFCGIPHKKKLTGGTTFHKKYHEKFHSISWCTDYDLSGFSGKATAENKNTLGWNFEGNTKVW